MDRGGFLGHNSQSYQMTSIAAASASLPATSRFTAIHGTSSAFSANANPNEDWTKISDLAERRRIQNRIAQRNYRKRLKRRLEDLERRAGSASASPETDQAENAQQPNSRAKESQFLKVKTTATRKRKTPAPESDNTNWSPSHDSLPLQQHETYGSVPEARGANSGSIYTEQLHLRQIAASPPTDSFFFQSYPSYSEDYGHHSSYPSPLPLQHNVFQNMPQSQYDQMPGQIASQHHLGHMSQPKQTNTFSDGQDLDPLYLNYASIAGLDIPASHQPQYDQQTQLTDTNRHRHLPIPTQTGTPRQPPQPAHPTNTLR